MKSVKKSNWGKVLKHTEICDNHVNLLMANFFLSEVAEGLNLNNIVKILMSCETGRPKEFINTNNTITYMGIVGKITLRS